jgi:hypothetical protein
MSQSEEITAVSPCVVSLLLPQKSCRRRTEEQNIPGTTEHFSFILTNWMPSIFFFYGMHPVVYLLVNGMSRSVYTTNFNC